MSQKGNYTKKINKIIKKNKAYHTKVHSKLFYKAQAKVLKLPINNRVTKLALTKDLEHANGDLMHYLATAATFTNKNEYIEDVDAYLSLEVATYKFPKPLKYEVGKMKELMEEIRVFHVKLDRYEELKKKVRL
jgi:hypothetical protein